MYVRAFVVVTLLSWAGPRFALAKLVIDDFSVAPVVVNGPGEVVQDQLPLHSVVGGERSIVARRFGDRVEVLADGGLQYTSDSGYGLQLSYGDGEAALISDPSVHGDRLVLLFRDSGSPAARLAYVFINALPTGSSYGLRFYDELRVLGEEGRIEFLLEDFPAELTSIRQITIDVARSLSTGGFILEEISLDGPPVPGDYNRDGTVDVADFDQWRQQFGRTSFQALFTADGNANHIVDAADYTKWRDNLGRFDSQSAILTPVVPEPSAVWLVVIGCLLVGVFRARMVVPHD